MTDYKSQLEAMLQNLTTELSAVGIHDPHNPADWIAVPEAVDPSEADSDMTADVIEEWDERQALVASLERQFNDITRALRKIETGTFGTCEIGGEAIEPERLNANPGARTCRAHMNEEDTLAV